MSRIDVLVIEDFPSSGSILADYFELHHYRARWCGTKADAIPLLELEPLAVVLDLRLSDGDGSTLIEVILKRLPDCRIVVWSAFVDDAAEKALHEAGVYAVVQKPPASGEVSEFLGLLPPPRSALTEGT